MLTLLFPEVAKVKFTPKFEISSCKVLKKIVLPESHCNAKKVSFEWSYHRISSAEKLESPYQSPSFTDSDGK